MTEPKPHIVRFPARASVYISRNEGSVPKMAEMASSYIQAHARLYSWNNELEFLGFILAELTDPRGLGTHGFPWHQAADLPALVDILEHQCTQPDGILKRLLLRKPRKRLRNWLIDSKKIRNAVAHHLRPSEDEMRAMQTVRDELGNLLEITIRTVAASRGVRQIGWCPYPSSSEVWDENLSYTTEPISLACGSAPLLSQRGRILDSIYHPPSQAHSKHKNKHRATAKDREEHSVIFIGALNRKLERRQQIKEKEKEARIRKLHRLDQNYRQMRQLRLRQLNRLYSLMKYEEREWRVQRSALLEDASIPFPAVDNAVFVILVISTPLWLLYSMIRTVYNRWGMHRL